MKLATIQLGAGCLFAGCIALSTVHPWGNTRSGARPHAPLLEGGQASDSVRSVLEAKCGDCHSERTHYPIYAHLAPVSWMIEHDIQTGRSRMNMSEWQFLNDDSRINELTRMASVVHTGQMPPPTYVMLHPGNRLSPQEQQQIYEWAKGERKRIRQQTRRSEQSSMQSGATRQ